MKITKSQLKQIIKEELEKTINEALTGGIDEFAVDMGVEPLPHDFTDQELVDFTYELLEASKAHIEGPIGKHKAHLPGPIAPSDLPEPSWKRGQTKKQTARMRSDIYQAAQRKTNPLVLTGHATWHPLTSATALDRSGKEVPVGMALEKLIQERFRKSEDPEMRKQLQDARMALLDAVSPSGRQARYAKSASERSALRKAYPDEIPGRGAPDYYRE